MTSRQMAIKTGLRNEVLIGGKTRSAIRMNLVALELGRGVRGFIVEEAFIRDSQQRKTTA